MAALETYPITGHFANSPASQATENYAQVVLDGFAGKLYENTYSGVRNISTAQLTTMSEATSALHWLTGANAGNGGEAQIGYYAFQYAFDLEESPIGLSAADPNYADVDLKVLLNFTLGSDDHVEAVFLNGSLLKSYLPLEGNNYGKEDWHDGSSIKGYFELDTDWLNIDGGNALTFIVHNDGHGGQAAGYSDGSNAFGFGATGSIALSTTVPEGYDDFGDGGKPETPSPTPEPATMLIFGIGMVGAGLVARRRVKK
ncbi:MAG: PEP-CTERM sorting domain-containing protein [Planctomycetaceae bacterium]|nr:PEP-CTERM sorting domain-containing protein [Planctomycetaceae bacterium]